MRKSLAAVIAVAALTMGVPNFASAQARSATLIGQVVDAGGRGSSGRTIELVSDGVVVGTTVSTYSGQFMFALGSAGTYVVRTMVNGHPAGIRIAVRNGENPPMAVLVLPSIARASYQGVLISSAINAAISAAATGASITVSAVSTAVTQGNDDEILADPRTRLEAAQVIQNIITQITNGASITVQPGQPLPPSIPGIPPELIQAINNVIINVPSASLGG